MKTTTTFKSFSAKSGAIRALRKLVGGEPSLYLACIDGVWGFHSYTDGQGPALLNDVNTTTTSDWADPAAAPAGETPAMTEDEAEAEITPCPGAFAALASTLTAEQAEAAEDAAIAAIVKAKAPRKATAATTSRAAALTAPYRLGAYKGRAGAMFVFMARCGTLGDDFTREDVVSSIVAKPCHAAVATRAQALDYFAWAARHGLLVELTAAEQQVRADRMADAASGAAEKKLSAKAARAARRAAKKVAA
jgi:hypothetical protein